MTARKLPSLVAAMGLWLLAGCAADPVEAPLPDLTGVEAEIAGAVEAARQRVADEPRSAAAWGALGDRYFAHEWFGEAAAAYARAAALDPAGFAWRYRQGLCLAGLQDLEAAATALSGAIEMKGDYAPAHTAYGEVLDRLGRPDQARRHYEAAIGINPRLSHPFLGLGRLALREGDLEAARRFLEEALRRNDAHGEAHHALAQVYMGLDARGRAAYHADRARSLPRFTARPDPLGVPDVPPAGSKARTDLGAMLEQQGDGERAEQEYLAAIRSNPDYMPAHYRLGRLLAKDGRLEDAASHLREALRLKGTARGVLTDLAGVLSRLGRHEEAIGHLERLVALDPADVGAREKLGEALAAAGLPARARAELIEARRLADAAGLRESATRIAERLRGLETAGPR